MKISGFQKLTLLDFPGKIACIIFTQGCNFCCSYCQNSLLIPHKNEELIAEEEIFEYLNQRKKILDGIVISGGEPTIQIGLTNFIKRVKELGLLVKLDTNGSNPNLLKQLIEEKLVDYVAMDIKNLLEDYEEVTKCKVNIANIKKSMEILKQGKVEYEFRTTIIKNIHTLDKILEICKYFDKKHPVYLQNFEQSEYVIDKKLESFTKDELIEIEKKVKKEYPNVVVRGL
jgi:pyruvate formate lyase activating enzyme